MKQDEFTLEDILEEQRQAREREKAGTANGARPPLPQGVEYVEVEPDELTEEAGFYPRAPRQQESPPLSEKEPEVQEPPQPAPQAPPEEPPEPPQPEEQPKKKKKKRKGLFSWRKKVPDFDENEDDMYYGIQLKPIDEYRLDGDAPPLGEEGYKALFDDSQAIDDEVEENFQRLQKERRRRVAEAVQSAGLDEQQVADEFGVAAPMPVTSFAADPYAQQHGLTPEGASLEGMSDLQKAMLKNSETMELKLNVLNSTVEIQKVREDEPPVSDEAVDRILASMPKEYSEEPQRAPERSQTESAAEAAPQRPVSHGEPVGEYREGPQQVPVRPQGERVAEAAPQRPVSHGEPVGEYREGPQQVPVRPQGERVAEAAPQRPVSHGEPVGEYREGPQQVPVRPQSENAVEAAPQQFAGYEEPVREYSEGPQRVPARQQGAVEPQKTREITREELDAARGAGVPQDRRPPQPPPRPVQEVPYVDSIFQYRSRNIPTHIINADALQSALLSEAESLQRARDAMEAKQAPRRRVRKKPPEEELPPEPPRSAEAGESIDDYTGPEDARSISNDLRGEMHALSLRMMITGVCTVLLALVSLVCRSRLDPKGSDAWPLAYAILTLVFLVVAVGICGKTVGNGLKALFSAQANADSGVSIAAAAALVQSVSAIFFRQELAEGGLHLYAVVAAALLFVNTIGKLTLVRRIHSNFRFLTSREDKFAVRLFEDYNTSLKMTKDCVAEKPLIAYQCKTGFLKRFLELSYKPDPSEASSQVLAPLGLICSLLLCIACLLITKNVPSSIGAFTAACCACVAAGNMLSVNLPVSSMCKTVRRAGGMVVGYEAVERLGDVNAVIADAGELFPTGTVTLNGIKTFGSRAVAEDAIMAASALTREMGGPLTGVFDQVISENEDALPLVEKVAYESGAGIVGRVDGKTIYIGNRGLLINHRLEAPSREEETQYASGNKNLIYIAVDAQVAALLVLSYAADRRRKNELQRLEDSGISVLVRTTDPNVTVGLVSRLFGVDSASVGVLDGSLGETAQKLTGENVPRADAVAATKGRMESMMSLIAACVEQKRTVGMLVAVQTAAVIMGFVLVAAVACFGGATQLSALILIGFQALFVGLLTIIPRFRR